MASSEFATRSGCSVSRRASDPGSAADSEDDDRGDVGDPSDRAEPAVRVAVVAACELDHEHDDYCVDHGHSGERGRVDVDHAEAFVAAVAAEPADRLAAPPEQEEQAGPGEDR